MIKRCGPDDLEAVHAILKHPGVYPLLCDDGGLPPDKFSAAPLLANNSAYFLIPSEGMLAMFVQQNFVTWELHSSVLPEKRGSAAFEAAKAVMQWMFDNTPCRKIVTNIPEYNRPAKLFAIMIGMKQEGKNRQSFLSGGILYDQFVYGIVKGEWTCQ